MAGYDAHYVPGWDCHGMPIEIQIEKKYGKNLPVAEMQSKARAYAHEQIDRQKKDFKRLGVLGQWDRPYMTMAFRNEANEIRALARHHGKRLCLPRPEARELVLRLRLGPGRKRKSNTRIASTRPWMWRFPSPTRRAWRAHSACPRWMTAPLSSGRRRPGRSPPTRR